MGNEKIYMFCAYGGAEHAGASRGVETAVNASKEARHSTNPFTPPPLHAAMALRQSWLGLSAGSMIQIGATVNRFCHDDDEKEESDG